MQSDVPPSTPSAAQVQLAKSTETALRRHGQLLSATMSADVFRHGVSCDPPSAGHKVIECEFAFDYGEMEPPWIAIHLQPDGSLSKQLGGRDPVPGSKTSEQTAALLKSDDYENDAPSRTRGYTCHASPRVERDGKRGTASASGQLCATHQRLNDRDVERYIEFASDGYVVRDYLLN